MERTLVIFTGAPPELPLSVLAVPHPGLTTPLISVLDHILLVRLCQAEPWRPGRASHYVSLNSLAHLRLG